MSRFAFISTLSSGPWGGSEELWSLTARELKTRGHDVFANVQWWPEVPAQLAALEAAGVTLTRRRIRKRDELLWGQRAQAKVYRWLDEVRPDLVLISLDSQSAGVKWMSACRERNLPYAIVVQAIVEQVWPGDILNEELAQGYESARSVFYLSPRNLQWLQTQFARLLPKARHVFNPCNVPRETRLEWPSLGTALHLACVGRLDPVAKGQDILFNVLNGDKWKERDIKVSLYGRGGYEQSLRNLAAFYELECVEFAGHVGNVTAIWENNHALVLPSRVEGLPLVAVEAMLCGRPCLVTDVAGNADFIEDNVSGFVASAPTVASVDEALERSWQAWDSGKLPDFGRRAAMQIRDAVPEQPVPLFATELENLS